MTEVSFRRYAIPDRLLERLDLGETPIPISAPDEFPVCLDAKDPTFVPGRSKGKAIDLPAKGGEDFLGHPGRTKKPAATRTIGYGYLVAPFVF
mgnify:CR=1 FL=1